MDTAVVVLAVGVAEHLQHHKISQRLVHVRLVQLLSDSSDIVIWATRGQEVSFE
jgi:hypothetical protein